MRVGSPILGYFMCFGFRVSRSPGLGTNTGICCFLLALYAFYSVLDFAPEPAATSLMISSYSRILSGVFGDGSGAGLAGETLVIVAEITSNFCYASTYEVTLSRV
jgi:hypothetical protein